jgi:chemotaxis protein methyltransferase CheR
MSIATQGKTLEDIELELLLEGLFQHYGYDFRGYSRASVKRRVLQTLHPEGVRTLSALQDKVLHDSECMDRLLLALSVGVTAMFRDPDFYLALREKAVPILRTYPFMRIWNVGCSTGEEAYSLAILLREEGLYDRCRIYATDMNGAALEQAQAGEFALSDLEEYDRNFKEAGGKGQFSEHYTTRAGRVVLDPGLKRHIVFAQHNLVTDDAFNEFNMVLCRNVLIYFTRELQDRVHELLYRSLGIFGVLGLGKRETIRFTSHQECYKDLDSKAKLYRKVA